MDDQSLAGHLGENARLAGSSAGGDPPAVPPDAYLPDPSEAAGAPPPIVPGRPLEAERMHAANRWARFFARSFDIFWETILLTIAISIPVELYDGLVRPRKPLSLPNGAVGDEFWNLGLLVVVLVLDACIFAAAGNTPGKALFRIRVVDLNGKRLRFAAYLKRNFSLWVRGLAFGIPLVNLVTMVVQFERLGRGERASYDASGGYEVGARAMGAIRLTFAVIVIVFTYMLIISGLALNFSRFL
ncbi:MAG: RDD family protein [Acidobacteriota bacterium]|jgi:uncharacterized RDD family membrane protein YckC